jgi:hypothetical protein
VFYELKHQFTVKKSQKIEAFFCQRSYRGRFLNDQAFLLLTIAEQLTTNLTEINLQFYGIKLLLPKSRNLSYLN